MRTRRPSPNRTQELRVGSALRWWPGVLLLAFAFLGHDLMLGEGAAGAEPRLGVSVAVDHNHHSSAAHHGGNANQGGHDRGGSIPSPDHFVGCGEVGSAVPQQLSRFPYPLAQAAVAERDVSRLVSGPKASSRRTELLELPKARRAALQVFLI